MNGWRYEWVDTLPRDVYDQLLEMLQAEGKQLETDGAHS